ncbi:CDP-diacylglycerol--glycerol-3-phosphate 3-phosphatidyltransferase [bioreactor metagenome]|uniref:CDP-diacylglycerol--glycerol-3-phosphate 3-phosphatidyltransferase n=1 Tax=bioreactor metagenome TaxID=1076179 RepID=A0A645EHJ0_9ZZZZ
MVTDFGKFADPLADKLLTTSAVISFVGFSIMPAWIALLILAREFIITALRTIAMGKGRVISASLSGKIKTAVQFTGIAVLLLMLSRPFHHLYSSHLTDVINYIMALVTVISGIDYLHKNKDLISQTK